MSIVLMHVPMLSEEVFVIRSSDRAEIEGHCASWDRTHEVRKMGPTYHDEPFVPFLLVDGEFLQVVVNREGNLVGYLTEDEHTETFFNLDGENLGEFIKFWETDEKVLL